MLKRKRNTGQSILEYAILIIVVIGSLVAMSLYLRRGIQGRWKSAVDDLGEQYDPLYARTSIRHYLVSSTNTIIHAENAEGGFYTTRTDTSASSDTRTGNTEMGVLPP